MGHALKVRHLKLGCDGLAPQHCYKNGTLAKYYPFYPMETQVYKNEHQMNNFNMLSTCPVLGLLVLSQIPARNWLDFWKEGIKDCGVS